MGAVKLDTFISDLQDCLGWVYKSPGSTNKDSSSGIDCSGMLVRAYKLQGQRIYHGSNTIWRNGSLTEKGKLTSADQLKVGYAVFKWSRSGEPEKYQSDGKGNFHHIGVVIDTNPVRIIHASSGKGKVVIDTGFSGWSHWGRLSKVDYPQQDQKDNDSIAVNSENLPIQQRNDDGNIKYKVIAENGSTVFLRSHPSKKIPYSAKVPVGTIVEARETSEHQNGWTAIRYGAAIGFMMSKFLEEQKA